MKEYFSINKKHKTHSGEDEGFLVKYFYEKYKKNIGEHYTFLIDVPISHFFSYVRFPICFLFSVPEIVFSIYVL